MEGGAGPWSCLSRVEGGCWTGLTPTHSALPGSRRADLRAYGNTVLLGENLGLGWEDSGGRGRRQFQNILSPQTLHQKDAYLQPVGPCRATVTLEAWLSLERVVGKDEETLLGRGSQCVLRLPPPWDKTPTPDLQVGGAWKGWHGQ